ncbi:hypothetical protein BGZ83_009361 [Gryganskiella cystojenkinii]|nr:hypothetical protein BGZ83_009361 [Gryganskiella cystojenkinii]
MPIARWAFNIRQPLLLENIEPLVTSLTEDDKPNIVPVSNLLNFLPKQESDRLLQFRQEDDMKRALIGRLMIHAFFAAHHGCRWDKLVFSRTENNKPILTQPEHLKNVSFNISHHGDWVIFVGDTSLESTARLGVDVMDFQEQVPGESFETFSACFLDQFTSKEMQFMTDADNDPAAPSNTINQLKRFYRMWCLKESTVKALGVGIDFNLKSFEFSIQQNRVTAKPILSTRIEVHEPSPNFPEEGWSFEEALLDDNHCYAIAAQTEMEGAGAVMDGSLVKQFDWNELLKNAVPYPSSFS